MQLKLPITTICLAALATPLSAIKTSFNASFDGLEGSLLARDNPVGIYLKVSYSNFGVSKPGLAGIDLAGVQPHSPPNIAIGTDSSGGSSLSIAYPGSKVKSLGLTSFYYGCNTALRQGAVETSVGCNVTLTGYKASSKGAVAAAKQTFEFTPPVPLAAVVSPPAFGTFSSAFQGLEYVNVTFEPATLVVVLIDNLVGYTVS